jgi:2-polyprenyl-3-methyl-5-hydroxy-6-metoxy-1,4-benzoquinol methylase
MSETTRRCWVCGNKGFKQVSAQTPGKLSPDNFKITDSHYGLTLPRYRCASCGFIQCDIADVTSFYAELKDEDYVATAKQRELQLAKLLEKTQKYVSKSGEILDIGAGSGIFVRILTERGYNAVGIEPSRYLAGIAQESDLPVICGTFPSEELSGQFATVYLTDVIEHVTEPSVLLKSIYDTLVDGGTVIVTTPDVSALVSRLLGKKWWHYRIAHIGYFNKVTLNQIMKSTGFKHIKTSYPVWYFSLGYILERLGKYLPIRGKKESNKARKEIILPVCFFDSITSVYVKE